MRDGLIVRNDAVADTLSIARQLGLVPDAGSPAEQRLFAAFNAKTRVERRAVAKRELERVADGVWLLRGGVPRTMNVYLLEDEGGGVTLFDAGIRSMTHALARPRRPLGGINRIVLGHADADHRGAAPGLRVPVFCHPADVEAAGSDEPLRDYHRLDQLGIPRATSTGSLMSFWDGGAVEIAGTVDEGDDGERLPRRAPARPRAGPDRPVPRVRPARADQRLLLRGRPETSLKAPPGRRTRPSTRTPSRRGTSIRKLAALDPAAAWPGHADAGDRRRARPARARRRGVMARKRAEGADERVPVAGRRRAGAARVDDAGDAARVPRTLWADPPLSQEDAWHRGVEFLFERLAVCWAVAGVDPITRQKELLARFRMASQDERRWIRDVLREHLAEYFPELPPP